jgi:oligosaccharide reducing-end xylanase
MNEMMPTWLIPPSLMRAGRICLKPLYSVLAIALLSSLLACAAGQPRSQMKGAAATGNYPNLFAQAGFESAEIRAKIDTAFQQLFHGDPQQEAVFYPDGRNEHGALGYIHDVNSNDVRSEGMSYGMMISVQLDRRAEFDALWNWAMTHMYHSEPQHPAYGYFAWSVKTNGEPIDEMPAPDGEEYFITALYFADARWGSREGLYDYRTHADRILTDVLHRKQITGATNRGTMTAVNLFDREARMVRFTPDVVNAGHTDASYHLPAFYEVWARVGPKQDRAFWSEAARVSRDYFYRAAHPTTGLTPDYGNFDASPWAAPWRKDSADFRYDAWRTAMNWSMDWSWWAADARQVELSNRLQAFFETQNLDAYESLYTLDGKPLGGGHTVGLVAMNAVASLAADHPRRHAFVRALWEQSIPTGQYRYYDGMLYLMALLHCSGEYRAWLAK